MSQKKLVRVGDVMKTGVDIVDRMDTVTKALEAMSHADSRCLIVQKRNEDDEYGIVMLADIAREVIAKDRAPERVNIYEIMSKPVISVPSGMDIRYCARLFANFGLSRAPVIDHGKVVGVVSYNDMVLKGLQD